MTTITFIGAGNLATSLIQGLATTGYQLHIASPNVHQRHQASTTQHLFTDNCEAIDGAEMIILAVKPHQISGVLGEIKNHLTTKQLLISLAAGLSVSTMATAIPNNPLVRAMPNIAASINESATSLYGKGLGVEDKTRIEHLFSALGTTTWLKEESHLDIATIIAGSMPAFVYTFIQAMIDGATENGISGEAARALALQAVTGACNLAKKDNNELDTLIKAVTSKGGTTEAGLKMFTQENFKGIVKQSFNSAFQRALALKSKT